MPLLKLLRLSSNSVSINDYIDCTFILIHQVLIELGQSFFKIVFFTRGFTLLDQANKNKFSTKHKGNPIG